MIKPIETVYKGYRFRSRLEARWAVFFDTAGIAYEYEKEGFDLGGAGWYLPDFWLPDHDYWVEIKSSELSNEQARAMLDRLKMLAEHTGHRAFALVGSPWFPNLEMSECYGCFGARPGGVWGSNYWWAECAGCGLLHLTYMGDVANVPCCNPITLECYPGYDSKTLGEAYKAARGARFEHGEKG